jgi:predicted nucleic acid-binding protein
MKLIIDTNIIFSGLIKQSTTREILLNPDFEFYIPDYYNIEFKKYKSYILEKFNGTDAELDDLIKIIHEKIIIVVEDEYSNKMKDAEAIIGKIDPKDIPFIALALSIENDGIWTRDKDFTKQDVIKIYSTRDLISIYYKKLNKRK